MNLKSAKRLAALVGVVLVYAGSVHAKDIGGTISSTMTITEDSQLVDDVTCTVTGAPCISIAAPGVTLELNGFTMTGQADAQTACSGSGGTSNFAENGIDVESQTSGVIAIRGPGLIQRFRGPGIFLYHSTGVTVTGVTVSTNCFSGILVGGGSDHEISGNVSVRNGNPVAPCGGIWMFGGASRNRLRGNRLSGNGYAAQGNNFGIGIEGNGTNDNVVEHNTITGNTNGLYLTAGVKGNIIRRNLVVGNPPIQVDLDHASAQGVDIKNKAQSGDNTFQGNKCLTSVNAPCPALQRQTMEDKKEEK